MTVITRLVHTWIARLMCCALIVGLAVSCSTTTTPPLASSKATSAPTTAVHDGGATRPFVRGTAFPGDPLYVSLLDDGRVVTQILDGRTTTLPGQIPLQDADYMVGWPPQEVRAYDWEGSLAFPQTDPFPLMRLISASSGIMDLPAPPFDGELVGAMLSPDGQGIAWLVDATVVEPNPFVPAQCAADPECVGWVYELYVPPAMDGSDAELVWTDTLDPQMQGSLRLAGWGPESDTVLVRRNPEVPSPFYPTLGGRILAIDIATGEETVVFDDLFVDVVPSPDGRWLAIYNDAAAAGAAAVRVISDETQSEWVVPKAEPGRVYGQFTFDRSSEHLYWVQFDQDEARDLDDAILREVWRMRLSDGGLEPVVSLGSKKLDAGLDALGPWVTDSWLAVSDAIEGRVLDVGNGMWVVEWPEPDHDGGWIPLAVVEP